MISRAGDLTPSKPSPEYSREQEIKILEAVDRVAGSGVLGTGDRMPDLLGYLVREELAGRGDRIKSFSIATDVLGRGKGFDPQSDSIARAEMTRLRKAINHYNAGHSTTDAVRITIPKGSYRPAINIADRALLARSFLPSGSRWIVFVAVAMLACVAVGMAAWSALRRTPISPAAARPIAPPLVVMQPAASHDRGRLAMFAAGLRGEVAAELAKQQWLTVIQAPQMSEVDDALKKAVQGRAVYLVEMRITDMGDNYTVSTFLKRWPDQAVRWSGYHDGLLLAQQTGRILRSLATEIARDLASPGGAIGMAEIGRIDGDARHEKRFACLIGIRQYWRSYDPAVRAEAEACLKKAVPEDPGFISGRAALALLSIESARQASGPERQRLLAEAGRQLGDPNDADLMAADAEMALAACTQDKARLRIVAKRMLAAYPNNPDVLADAGSKLGLAAGDWAQALDLQARARALNPLADPWYRLAAVAKAMLDGDALEARDQMSRTPQRLFRTGHIIRLAVSGAAGDMPMMADATARLAEFGIRDRHAARAAIDGECWSDDVKEAFGRGVDAAMR